MIGKALEPHATLEGSGSEDIQPLEIHRGQGLKRLIKGTQDLKA